jgi:Xaa-Pro aminopeptidase
MRQRHDTFGPSYARRLARTQDAMREAELDLLFLPPGADVTYLTGAPPPRPFWSGDGDLFALASVDGLFVPRSGEPLFSHAPSVWANDARDAIGGRPSLTVDDDWPYWKVHGRDATVRVFERARETLDMRAARVGVGGSTPLHQVESLRAAFPSAELVTAPDLVGVLRQYKEPEEIERLAGGQAATAAAFEAALGNARVHMTTGDLVDELADQQLRHGADVLAFPPDLYVVGPAVSLTYAATEHERRTLRLEPPCAVCVDMSGVFGGYCSDFARTVFFGEPDSSLTSSVEVVNRAQARAVEAVRPGVVAAAVDRAARDVVESAGLGRGFWTGAGHGIGLQLHEPPALMHGTSSSLESSMVLAVEVGVWIDGEVGAFCEDLVLVTDDGGEWLGRPPDRDYVVTS